jgi:hypothetical protein
MSGDLPVASPVDFEDNPADALEIPNHLFQAIGANVGVGDACAEIV